MKRFFVIPLVTMLVVLAMARSAEARSYGWTISNSSSDPFSNTGPASYSVTTLYLWLQCCDTDGMAAAEFAIESTNMSHLATTPQGFFLNAGGTSDLLLAVGGCPCGPALAAKLLVVDSGGMLCFAPSVENGILGTVDCAAAPGVWTTDWIGYSSTGSDEPCHDGKLCRSDDLEDASWGEIKGLYK